MANEYESMLLEMQGDETKPEDTPPKVEDTPPKVEDTPPKVEDTPPKVDEPLTIPTSLLPEAEEEETEEEEEETTETDESINPETGEKWKSAGENVKALVGIKKDLTKRLKEAEEKLANPPAPVGGVTQEDFDAMVAERDTALDSLAKLDLAQDPRFIQKFGAQQAVAVDQAKRLVEAYGLEGSIVEDAKGLSPKARMEFLQEKVGDAWQQVATIMIDYDKIELVKQREIEDARASKEALDLEDSTRSNEMAMNDATQITRLFDSAVDQYANEGVELLIPVKGHAEWNAQVDQVQTSAKEILKNPSPEAFVKTALLASTVPAYRKMYLLVSQQLKERDDELAEITDGRPSLRSRTKGVGANRGKVPAVAPKDIDNASEHLADRVFKDREFRTA